MSQDHWEYMVAHSLLKHFMRPPEVVLEIGVYGGWTMMGWLMLGTRRAIAIDKLKRPTAPFDGKVYFIEADSHSSNTLGIVKELAPNGVDFLFIDGDHTMVGCAEDYNMYSPLVRSGGAIGFHDILNGDVRATWREMVKRYPTVQIQNRNPDGSALGIGLAFALPGIKFDRVDVCE